MYVTPHPGPRSDIQTSKTDVDQLLETEWSKTKWALPNVDGSRRGSFLRFLTSYEEPQYEADEERTTSAKWSPQGRMQISHESLERDWNHSDSPFT